MLYLILQATSNKQQATSKIRQLIESCILIPIVLFSLFTPLNSSAQSIQNNFWECQVIEDSTPVAPQIVVGPVINPPAFSCSNPKSSVYQNFFKKQQNFIPTDGDTTPESVVKNIKVRFVIVEKNDTGPVKTNFRMSDTQDLQTMVLWLNQFFSGSIPETAPTNPVVSVCGGNCYIKDRRIRVDLTGIDFVNDPQSYTTGGIGNSNVINIINDGKYQDSILNIFFYVDSSRYHTDTLNDSSYFTGGAETYCNMDNLVGPDNGKTTFADIFNTYLTASYYPVQGQGLTYGDILWQETTRLFHELNHALGLGHLQKDSSNSITNFHVMGRDPAGCDNDADTLPDAYPNHTCPMPYADDSTNNVMNMGLPGGFGEYLSPLQIGRINRDAFLGSVSKYIYPAEPPEEHPWIVDSNQTWDFPIRMFQDIVVTSGHTLTIKCEVQMPHDSRILVQKNAELIIDSGQVTSYGPTYNWAGIELEGDTAEPPLPQYQGSLVMKNNAEIDYAWHGIRNFTWDNGAQGGGIIDVENSTVRNCWRSVELNDYPYSYLYYVAGPPPPPEVASKCKFKNVNFIIDDTMAFRYHHTAQDLFTSYDTRGGIQIINCRFANSLGQTTMPQQERGGAIYTLATGMTVKGSSFYGFKKGIYATGYGGFPDRTVQIYQDTFNYITENITIGASPYGDIRANSITNMLPFPDSIGMQNGWGIYLDHTNNTVVKCYNYVDGMTDGHTTFGYRGIVVDNSYPYDATVINNTFTNLFAATETQLSNPNLSIFCNGYSDNSYGLLVNPQSSGSLFYLQDQGTGCLTQETRAGNTFENNWLDIASYLTNDWNYYWWNSNVTTDQNPANTLGTSVHVTGCLSPNGAADPNSQCDTSGNMVCMAITNPLALNNAVVSLYSRRSSGLRGDPLSRSLFNNVIQGYNNLNDQDGLKQFLENEQTDAARRSLIPLYLETDSFTEMTKTIGQLRISDAEKNAYTEYYTVLKDLKQSGRSVNQLTTSELNTVQSIADSNYEVSGYAKALLEGGYQISWAHPVEDPPANRPASSSPEPEVTPAKSQLYAAVPNPASGATTIMVYITSKDAGQNKPQLLIHGITGAMIYKSNLLQAGKNEIIVNTQGWNSGIYFYSLTMDGAVVESKKLSVRH